MNDPRIERPRSSREDAPAADDGDELPAIHRSLSAPPTRMMRRMGRKVEMVTRDATSEGREDEARRD